MYHGNYFKQACKIVKGLLTLCRLYWDCVKDFWMLSHHNNGGHIVFDRVLPDIEETTFMQVNQREYYGDLKEEIPNNMPRERGNLVEVKKLPMKLLPVILSHIYLIEAFLSSSIKLLSTGTTNNKQWLNHWLLNKNFSPMDRNWIESHITIQTTNDENYNQGTVQCTM